MTNLRTAAQNALKALDQVADAMPFPVAEVARRELRAALAQPEPAAPQPAGPEDMEVYAAIAANYKAAPTVVEPNSISPELGEGESDLTIAYMAGFHAGKRAATPPRAALTDAEIDAVTDAQWGRTAHPGHYAAYRAYARAIEAAITGRAAQ